MTKRMLIDATHAEETRVVVLNGNRLDEFDFETSTKKQLKGNIYLAKVTRVEPSLQAAFVEFGGNRHGFLAFSEIHPDYYQIPVADRAALIREHEEALAAEAAAEEAEDDEIAEDDDDDEIPPPPEPPEEITREIPSDTEDGGDAQQDALPAESAEAPASETVEMPAPEAPAETAEGEAAPAAEEFADSVGDQPVPAPIPLDDLGGEDDADVHHEERRRTRPRRHRYKIQEVIKRRQILLVQVVKEERGNKGAALTTYLSLAGRYCVLMPNTAKGGGISRKINSSTDRKRLKSLISEMEIPDGMAVILRTAAVERSKAELKRDFEFLMRSWDQVRELTLQSIAPTLVYEEANLIKRSIRDLYTKDIDEVQVEGEEGYKTAKDFMRMLMPSHAKKVQPYRDPEIPLFHRYQVEGQLDAMHSPQVQLKSGGYIVINPTEALVSIDVNSGRATRERNIEETAYKTNLEAADEIARQLRLRDLAGLIVIDFIDMAEHRNQHNVERRMKEAMRNDRARIQIGRISAFGLLELSRQRLRPSLIEASTQPCPHCQGTGLIRSTESAALHVLRAIEEEGIRRRSIELNIDVDPGVALYILNQKRDMLRAIESRYGFRVSISGDSSLIPPTYKLERVEGRPVGEVRELPKPEAVVEEPEVVEDILEDEDESESAETESRQGDGEGSEERGRGRRRRRRRGRRGRRGEGEEGGEESRSMRAGEGDVTEAAEQTETETSGEPREGGDTEGAEARGEGESEGGERAHKRRRRGRRGGRRRRGRDGNERSGAEGDHDTAETAIEPAQAPQAETGIEPEPAVAARGNGEDKSREAPVAETPPAEPTPAITAVEAEAAPKAEGPKRKGWWNRFGN
jgi:ribonuclease E